MFNFFKRKNKGNSKEIQESKIVFRESGIINVTNFSAMSIEDSLGYVCSCVISVLSNGIIEVHSCEKESKILETISVSGIHIFSNNVNNYDPMYATEVLLTTDDYEFLFSFESVEIKRNFANSISALLN